MQTLPLKISEETARKVYSTATPEMQAVLEDTFTKPFFSQKITDRVKSFEDACQVKGISPADVLPFSSPKDATQKALNATAKIWLIIEVINEGWVPDLSNTDQYKYYPWFEQKPGFGLSFDGYAFWYSGTCSGVRLCLENKEKAVYVGKQFIDIYQEFMLIK